MSFFQAIVIGLLQGVTELFPVSSLGHSVLVPAWLGWDSLLNGEAADESFFLAFIVGLHVDGGRPRTTSRFRQAVLRRSVVEISPVP